jgi:predicted amidohydrolase YtcJ
VGGPRQGLCRWLHGRRHRPHAGARDDAPDNTGIAVTPPDELRELARQADEAGFSLAVHAIGDQAIRDTIDAMAKFLRDAGTTHKLPHLIEHVQVIHPDDLPRLSQHGIVASMQPVHVLSDWRTADRVWGQRARYAYAFRSLIDRGTHMSFGSDAPYEALNPMEGIYAAVARRDRSGEPEGGWYPEERITVAEAIHGFTMGPAYASGWQAVQGSITPGKWADVVLLSRDMFEIPADEIAETEVVLTIFDGRAVYRKE